MRENVVSYKYDYAAKKSSGLYFNKVKIYGLLILLAVFIALSFIFIKDGQWLFFIIAFIVWVSLIFILMAFSGEKRLYITPRYLLCGDDIIYYRNVTAIQMQEHTGQITIQTPTTILTLNRDNFPTNARKDHKIAINKEEKFRKVSDKIIKRVKAINPSFRINAPVQTSAQQPSVEQPLVQQSGTQPRQQRVRDLSRY